MSYIVLGGRPLLGGGSVFGLYVARDAITNLKIVDTLGIKEFSIPPYQLTVEDKE